MGFLEAFKFRIGGGLTDNALSQIYPFGMNCQDFVRTDVKQIYTKILTDCIERTQGIPENIVPSIWDNCLASESKYGLISFLAEAMTDQADLFLVYKNSVLRKADNAEREQIEKDYKTKAKSSVGTFISFSNYERTTILKILSTMEYDVFDALNKKMNLAKAIQLKMSNLRDSVSNIDADDVIAQARSIAQGLAQGKDVFLDKLDEILSATPEMESTKQAIAFLDAKRAFALNLPLAYLTGDQTPGIGSTGEADTKATERGLKPYYISITRPALVSIYNISPTSLKFRSQDFRQISSALETIKTFSLVGPDSNLISLDNQRLIVSTLLDVENDMEGEPVEDDIDDNSQSEGDAEEDSAEDEDQETGKARKPNG